MNYRHKDNNRSIISFNEPTLVKCPKCGNKAITSAIDPDKAGMFASRKLVCTKCSYTDLLHTNSYSTMNNYSGRDNYFNLPLWLLVPCGKNFIFAYNEDHLDILESYIGANLRERKQDAKYGWTNRSMLSRLPTWVKLKKNRALVVKALNKLRNKLNNT